MVEDNPYKGTPYISYNDQPYWLLITNIYTWCIRFLSLISLLELGLAKQTTPSETDFPFFHVILVDCCFPAMLL
jgi:hypothetical protein